MAAQFSQQNRAKSFRKLLDYISERLSESQVRRVNYLYEIPVVKESSALDTLIKLEKRGEFSSTRSGPLVKLLEQINECDVAEYVKNDYQTRFPDHTSVSRAASLPPSRSPNITRTRERTRSCGQRIEIVISPPEESEQHGSKLSTLPEGCFEDSSEQSKSRPQSETFSVSASECSGDGEDAMVTGLEVFSEDHEARPRFSSASGKRILDSLGSGEENKRHYSWPGPQGVQYNVNITLNYPTPPASPKKSMESLHDGSDKENKISDGDNMKSSATPILPIPSRQTPEFDNKSHGVQNVQSLKKRGQKLSRKGKKSECDGEHHEGCHVWSIEGENLLKIIRPHRNLECIKYSHYIPIDIACGYDNPFLLLNLYPCGLFSDARKSVTLQFKVIIPDNCPPVPTSDSFDLRWKICIESEDKDKREYVRENSLKVKFETGLGYVKKFLPHNVLQQYPGRMLEVEFFTNTTLSMEKYNDVDDAPSTKKELKPSDKILLTIRKALGNRKLANEIGERYHVFGHSLLCDDEGTETRKIEASFESAVEINNEIFGCWLQGRGRQPVEWDTIIATLRDISMDDLASHIEHNLAEDKT